LLIAQSCEVLERIEIIRVVIEILDERPSEAREVNEETSALACARPTPERTDFHPLGV